MRWFAVIVCIATLGYCVLMLADSLGKLEQRVQACGCEAKAR